MPNNRTKGNDTLRKKLKLFLKKMPREKEFHINSIVTTLTKLNKNYNITSPRVANLLKEQENLVVFIKSGIWMKL